MKLHHGWAFPDADQFMVSELSVTGTYQEAHLTAALRYVTDFRSAIDGGAHIGTWSALMAERFAAVHAFEPSPDTFECLTWNMAQRAIDRVTCHPVALGERAGSVAMTLDPLNAARANTGARHVQSDAAGTIPVITIDSLALDGVGFLKLDIEGSEVVALRGALETLRRWRPIVLFENKKLWTRYFDLPKNAVERLLMAERYHLLETVSMDQIWGPKP